MKIPLLPRHQEGNIGAEDTIEMRQRLGGAPDSGPKGPPPPTPAAGLGGGGDQRFETIYLNVLLIYFCFTDTKSSIFIVKMFAYNLALLYI